MHVENSLQMRKGIIYIRETKNTAENWNHNIKWEKYPSQNIMTFQNCGHSNTKG